MKRRAFLAGALATGAAIASPLGAATPPPVRFKWPWPVKAPDPHALGDLTAALLAATLYPPLYVRAVDGMLEPRLALAGPKEIKNGLRIDLVPGLRPSDVLASIAAAKSRGGRLALRDVPVPRVEGEQSVAFPGYLDPDGLMRRLATPLAGIARIEPRRVLPTGGWDASLKDRDGTTALEVTRRPVAAAVGVPPPGLPRLGRFEVEGVVDLARSLRTFERFESEVSYLADGLFAPRPGARPMDLGPLAYVGLRAGSEVPELQQRGAVQRIVESLPADRFGHLGFLRRGHVAPESTAASDVAALAPNVAVVARVSQPLLVGAAEILARELGGIARVLDDATFARVEAEGRFPLLLDVVRPIDETAEGAAVALATFGGAAAAPKSGATPHAVGLDGTAALGWEIPLLGAQASHVWIPRAAFGGFDLGTAAVG